MPYFYSKALPKVTVVRWPIMPNSPHPQSKSRRQVWTNFSIPPLAADCSISDPPPSPGCFKGKILLSSVKIIRNIGGGGQLCLDIITLHQKKLSSSSMREKSASSCPRELRHRKKADAPSADCIVRMKAPPVCNPECPEVWSHPDHRLKKESLVSSMGEHV